jgi:adenylate kinase family enzyme
MRSAMNKVAIFGNAGGGKSTLATRLAALTGLPLFPLDAIKYHAGGGEIPDEEYLAIHAGLVGRDAWIIDGFGTLESTWDRLARADTLVYVDLPLFMHFWWVTKRLITGFFVAPEGWPENSPIWKSSMNSYRVLRLCHRYLTPEYRQYVAKAAATKRVHHLRSPAEVRAFLVEVQREHQLIAGSR